ncbi:glycosyltransferase family 2 protein [Paenibacillus antibioticophila]|uniref:glycosyltransferase family 2 protein n=1 Tax=Paenibacillus antibioticophila TaxID=1274374 RepID=UPI0011DCDE0A|nr:glycosyltransferase [Paenibacillus antibioticophila]
MRKERNRRRPVQRTGKSEPPRPKLDLSAAYAAGAQAGAESLQLHGKINGPMSRSHFQSALTEWFADHIAGNRPPYSEALALCSSYQKGYAASRQENESIYGVPLPLVSKASAVITACNEEDTIGKVINELERLPLSEIIVVLNGCTDNSFSKVAWRKNIILVNFPDRLGHDVGRSVGAALVTGDSILFVDGDMEVPAEELGAFLYEQEQGADVVLNDISRYLPPYERQDEVTRCKLYLNQALDRPDLRSNSLTAVPHVLSRKALETVGTEMLLVPPKAQAIAIMEGLAVAAPCSADVISRNRLRQGNSGAGNSVLLLILGDHLEALNEAIRRKGTKLSWETASRSQLAKVRNG